MNSQSTAGGTPGQDFNPWEGGTEGADKENDALCEMQEAVQNSVTWRKDAKYDDDWVRLIKLYSGQYEYEELAGYDDVVAPNMIFSTANVIIPSVSVNYPKITVTPRQEIMLPNAAIVEAVSNYEWQHNDVHVEFGLAVKDFVLLGHGWCKCTWLYATEDQPLNPQEYQDAIQQALLELQQAHEMSLQAGLPTDDLPSDQEVVDSVPKTKTVVKDDRANVERISPFDIFVDPTATRERNMRWIAQRMYVPLEKARKRADWDRQARKMLTGHAMSEIKKEQDLSRPQEQLDKEPDFAIVWEFYDLLGNTVSTFAEGCDRFLSKPIKIDLPFDHPFVMLKNYEVPDRFYPIGDIEPIVSLQLELAMTRTQMINDRKRFRRMYLMRPDSLGPDAMDQVLGGDDNIIVEVKDDRPFADVFAAVTTSSLPPEFYNQTAMMLDDINIVTGVTEYQRGAVAEVRRTATEANMIQDGANARSASKLAIVERSIGEVAKKIVALSQQFLTSESVVRIIGPNDAMSWQQYTADDLQGEYDFSVEAGSTQPQNESSRRQSAMQLMDAMTPFMGTVVDPRKMAEYILRTGFGIKTPNEFMIDPQILLQSGINPATGQPLGSPPPGAPGANAAPPAPPQG